MQPRKSPSRLLLTIGSLLVAAGIVVAAVVSVGSGESDAQSTKKLSVEPARLTNPNTPGRVLFLSNFETEDFPEWYVQALPNRVRLVHKSPFQGDANALFEVRPGDIEPDTGSSRAEVSGPNFYAGQDLYVRLAIRVPDANDARVPWELVQQFHDNDSDGASPGTAVFLTTGRRLRVGAGDSSQIDWSGPPLALNRWYELVYRVKFSREDNVGFVEVWLDGEHERLENGQFREYGRTMNQSSVYLKDGIYRAAESTGTSVVEEDSVIVVERKPN